MRFASSMRPMMVLMLAAALLTGCAHSRGGNGDEGYANGYDSDPIEPFNRAMFRVHEVVDAILLKPIAKVYRAVVPEPVRDGLHNVLVNLTEPVTFANAVLQADPDRAFKSFWRFVLNSTYGFGGIRDFAGQYGLPHRGEDFGQTLGRYGSGPGFYLFLPVLGPMNGRDAVGRVVDVVSDPAMYLTTGYWQTAKAGANGLDVRERNLDRVDEIYKTSLDPYATIRSAYGQRRDSEIRNGRINPKTDY